MMEMNSMIGMGGLGTGVTNSQYFIFAGNSLSLQARLQTMSKQADAFLEAKITVVGVQTKPPNNWSIYCTIIWGMFTILPLFLICFNWWKKCSLPVYQIDKKVYQSLGKLFTAARISNITMEVKDNTFGQEKAQLIYNLLQGSRVKGFTFVNLAQNYDCNESEYSNFVANMRPIKSLSHITSDIRWDTQIVTN